MNDLFALAELLPLLNKVEQFRLYKANWGSYGEKAVSSESCDQAKRFIVWLVITRPNITIFVYPCANGSIGVEFGSKPKDYAVVFSKPVITLCHGTGDNVRKIKHYKTEFWVLAAAARLTEDATNQ